MKVLLVSEGKHELSGSLESLVRRISSRELDVHHDRVSRNDIHTHRGKGQGFFKRAIRWLLEARKRGYEAIVLVIDEDGYAERTSEIKEAQYYSGVVFPRAFGIAIRTFDAWMLADERALTTVLGCQIQRQPAPEYSIPSVFAQSFARTVARIFHCQKCTRKSLTSLRFR